MANSKTSGAVAVKTMDLPLSDLVEDMSIYPRHALDHANVARLVRALESGATLPPPVVDHASKRIVDGWHRYRAYRHVLGPAGVIPVEVRAYHSDRELVLAAIALNAGHGRQFDKIDEIRCVRMAEAMGIELHRVAVVLHRSDDDVRKLIVRVATVPPGTDGAIPGTQYIAVKRPVMHLAGKTLTREQADAQPSVPGVSYLLLTRQLTDAVSLELANRDDATLMTALATLRDALVRYFTPHTR